MKLWIPLIAASALFTPAVHAQTYPNFTQGSMTSTTVTETEISETITIERYGGDYTSYSGYNVTPSGAIDATDTTFSVTTAGEEYQHEIVTRSAGIVETELQERTITQTSTTNSLSVFSQ
jgi:hypothetical protein